MARRVRLHRDDAMMSAWPVAGMPRQHSLHHDFQVMRVGRDALPEDGIADANVLVTDTVADSFDLAPRLGWKVGEPVVRITPHCLRNGLDCVGRRTANDRIVAE